LTSTKVCWLLRNGVRRLILLYVLGYVASVGMSTDMTSWYHYGWVHDGVWCFTYMDWSSCGGYSLERDFGWCLVWADNTNLSSGNMAGFRLGFTLDDGAV
jgi:hypothetical protein